MRAYALVLGCAFLCFLAWPASGADWRATVALPANPSATELVLAWVYALDPARNVCPSVQVGLMTVATCAARRCAAAPVRWIYVLGLPAISFAVLAIRQHVVMDSLLGLTLGAGVSRWQLPDH